MKIRRAKLSDGKELYKILNKTPELRSGTGRETYSLSWIKGAIKDKKTNLTLIAEENKEIIGFLMAEINKNKKYSYWIDLFVKKQFRNKGIAKKLIKKYYSVCDKLKLERIHCLILLKNKKMQKIMKKMKYKQGEKFYFYEKKLKWK